MWIRTCCLLCSFRDGPATSICFQAASVRAAAGTASSYDGHVAQLPGRVVKSLYHTSTGNDSSSNSSAHEKADQIAHASSCAITPLTPCGGTHVVGHHYGYPQCLPQPCSQGDIPPLQIGSKEDHSRGLIYLSGHSDAHGLSRMTSLAQKGLNAAWDFGDDAVRALLRFRCVAVGPDDLPSLIDKSHLDLGTAQVHS